MQLAKKVKQENKDTKILKRDTAIQISKGYYEAALQTIKDLPLNNREAVLIEQVKTHNIIFIK